MEALELLQKVTEKVEAIKNDNAIPMRSNKKTGAKSKKEIREQVQAEASSTLKEISQKYGLTCGKWLIFAPPDRIDAIWSGIARSLASGPLTTTSAFSAKVSTSPEHEVPSYQHVICVYVPDVYNKDSVIEVMKVLVRNHGVNLSGVKSDLYTLIGLDSKHPSGVPSTVWKNTALLPESEIKEMKGAYFTELASAKAAEKSDDQKGTTPRKTALKKRKRDADDPFASDDDNGGANVASGSTEGNAREGAEKVERSKTRKGKTRV
ncbi:hypothetical protein ID866_950 [Astraeus odoratus]|nr:hypothetical protein ID866_950 [Astraeus odoratus]